MGKTSRVVIGMDPHKRTVTIEAMSPDEAVVDRGRFTTDVAGFEAMLAVAAAWPERVWAVEGCEGIGKHVALRLLDHGETVVDVPAKLSPRMHLRAGIRIERTWRRAEAASLDQRCASRRAGARL